ncbi:MAG: c-type cytochrome biogenesis protein CcmI [Psychromonas sp.]|nr:c-type cytochrome biogenesis protein CcmI [Psychromonas sp.]
MILQFWLFVILLLIMASIIFILPFVRGYKLSIKKEDSMSRNQLNSDLYAVRLAEIEQDDAQGLIIDKEDIIEELQHNLLDDIHETPSGIETRKNALIWLPGILFLILGSVGMYLSLGTYKEVKHLDNVLENYKSLQHKLFDKSNQKVTQQDLKDFSLGLRVQLNQKPNDPSGWLLYSRLEMMFGHYGVATSAIDKAYALDSQSIDIRLVYIELKMQSEDLDDQHKSQKMVVVLLKEDPNEVDAWSLYAFMALQAKEYKSAIFRWNKMLKLVDPHSKKAILIRDSIVFVQGKIAEKIKAQSSS